MSKDKEERVNILTGVPCDEELVARLGMPPYTPPSNDYEKIPCETCKELMWIGARQRAMKAQNPDTPILCMGCVIELQRTEGEGPLTLQDLGGP